MKDMVQFPLKLKGRAAPNMAASGTALFSLYIEWKPGFVVYITLQNKIHPGLPSGKFSSQMRSNWRGDQKAWWQRRLSGLSDAL